MSGARIPTSTTVHAVIGLGNPGPRYADTRHNIGFMVVDELARRDRGSWQSKFKAEVCRIRLGSEDVWLAKPMTYMNLSGDPTQRLAAFYKLAADTLLVLHDDLDLPYGELRVKAGGGHGGHNGLRSLVERLGKRDFLRLRIGIGRPAKGDPADYVLSPFSPDERIVLSRVIDTAADVVELIAARGVRAAMNETNGRKLFE